MKKPFLIAEIGINHNGDINIVKNLIDNSVQAGFDAVKFQKRDINIVYSKEILDQPRKSPWGETQRDQKNGLLELEINAEAETEYITKVIGTRKGNEEKPDLVGQTLATVNGTTVRYQLKENELYFRATVTSSKKHPRPSFSDQKEQAWTQPIWNVSK